MVTLLHLTESGHHHGYVVAQALQIDRQRSTDIRQPAGLSKRGNLAAGKNNVHRPISLPACNLHRQYGGRSHGPEVRSESIAARTPTAQLKSCQKFIAYALPFGQ
jgi:hypothetical protein